MKEKFLTVSRNDEGKLKITITFPIYVSIAILVGLVALILWPFIK